jgi:diguanylate cyclase (GGDEF)-like protein
MTKSAKAFLTGVIAVGAVCFVAGLRPFDSAHPLRFLCFLFAGAAASGIRHSLPKLTGTLSINFIFILIGILALSASETMLLAAAVTLLQCLFHSPGRLRPVQIAFNIAAVSIGVRAGLLVSSMVHNPGDELAQVTVRLFVAAPIFYLVNTVLVSLAISLSDRKPLVPLLRDCFSWTLPYFAVGSAGAGAFSLLTLSLGWPVLLLLLPLVYMLYRHYRLHLSRSEAERRHSEEMAGLHMRVIETLALVIEVKDHASYQQRRRIQTYAGAMGEDLRLNPSEQSALLAAAMLHDIGMLAVPGHIVSKPGRLTPEEFERVKIHALVGAEILERVRFPYPVAPIVRHHHEKWDGSGYPDGLAGDRIPMGARILAVCDTYVQLTSERPFHQAVSSETALDVIAAESGTSFDPRVVAVLMRRHAELEQRAQTRQIVFDPLIRSASTRSAPAGVKPDTPATEQLAAPAGFLASIAAARQEAQILFELAQELGNSLSLDETLSVFAVRLRKSIPYDAVAIFVIRGDVLEPEYVSGENSRLLAALRIPVGRGLSGWVAERRKPVFNGDPHLELGYKEDPNRHTPLRSALSIPLEGVNSVAGVITLYCSEKDAFSRDHLRLLQAISAKVALSMENALKYRQAESSASTDFLTGLLNARSLFLHLDSEVARCRRLESPLAVLVSDLDRFKQVNDRFGHMTGNQLLQRVAQRLKDNCREYDCVARMGGDEFVIVMPGLTKDDVRKLVPRLREVVREAGIEVLGEDLVGFSLGEAYFPADGKDAEQLLAEADRRMYQFKARQKILTSADRGFDFDVKPKWP